MNRNEEMKLAGLIYACLEGHAGQDHLALLEEQLQGDPEAQQYYGEFLAVYADLRQSGATLLTEPCEATASVEPPQSDPKVREIEQYANRQLEAFLDQEHANNRRAASYGRRRYLSDLIEDLLERWRRLAGVTARTLRAGFVCGLIALVTWIAVSYVCTPPVVATLGDSVHAQWETAFEDAQLRRGSFHLQEGFAEIELTEGAQVILQAPCKFTLETGNRLFLESGSISAHVPDRAQGFAVETRSSKIVDFGTDFGVLAQRNGRIEAHVHQGRVSVASGRKSKRSRAQRLLTDEHAASVDASGNVREIPYHAKRIARKLPRASDFAIPGKRLSLADVVGGGNGFGTGEPNTAIDIMTGQFEADFYLSSSDSRLMIERPARAYPYVPVSEHAYIDGVFIPTKAPGPITISSQNHAIALSPTPATIVRFACRGIGNWSVPDDRPAPTSEIVLDGQAYGSRTHPVMLMRMNKGITFDLQAIRVDMPGVRIERFTALCGISATDRETAPEARASFYVLVDGAPRFTQTDAMSDSTASHIDIPLQDNDRFLTLITAFTVTAPGQTHRAVFAEPALELMPPGGHRDISPVNQDSQP